MVKRYVSKKIPKELDERLRVIQQELRKMGLNANFQDSGRVAAKRLENAQAKIFIKKRKHGKPHIQT